MAATRAATAPDGASSWRLEAFDLRAGLAFATLREPQSRDQQVRDWPCYFLSPPAFTPEPVDNVAAAFAATRGTFSAGLFVGPEDIEASFRSLADVAEFVRRAYLGSAGGDGSDAGGDSGPTPPGEPPDARPPDLPENKEKQAEPEMPQAAKYSAHHRLKMAVERFETRVEGCRPGDSFEAAWDLSASANLGSSLSSGAVHAMRELLLRHPPAFQGDGLAWLGVSRAFGACVANMGLWPELLSDDYRHIVAPAVEALHWCATDPRADLLTRVFILFFDGPMPDDPRGIALYRSGYARYEGALATDAGSGDPLDLLLRFPLPGFAQPVVAADLGTRASLYHLLATALASPQALMNVDAANVPKLIDLLLFTAACVVSSHVTRSYGSVHPSLMICRDAVTPLQRAAIERIGQESLSWLKEHLPLRGFAPGLEARIAVAKDIRYAAPG